MSQTGLRSFLADDNKKPRRKNNVNVNLGITSFGQKGLSIGTPITNDDLIQTLELKDEALLQAQTAVSSLELALDSAVTNLEKMQQQLQLKVIELEKELKTTKQE